MANRAKVKQDGIDRYHEVLLNTLEETGYLEDERIRRAFEAVPRHLFLPDVDVETAYSDRPVVIKTVDGVPVSSSSQPSLMATMLQLLELELGQNILEIGAGTGYNAALMAHIVGASGHVTTVEIAYDIANAARAHLLRAGISNAFVVSGDGGHGYVPLAPYDRIIVTAGAWDLLPTWTAQLKEGGRILLPLSIRGLQYIIAFERSGEVFTSRSITSCNFMRLRGEFARDAEVRFCAQPGHFLIVEEPHIAFSPEDIDRLFSIPSLPQPTSVTVTATEVLGGLGLWIASHDAHCCLLFTFDANPNNVCIPPLVTYRPGTVFSIGLLDRDALTVLCRSGREATLVPPRASFRVETQSYGRPEGLADRLTEHLVTWEAAGRPTTHQLTVEAYPPGIELYGATGRPVVDKQYTRLVFNW